MNDLRKRAEALSTETDINLYKKALKWQQLAMEAIAQLELMEIGHCKTQ